MGNTFLVLFSPPAVAVATVDPVGNAQRCPQVHRRRFWFAQTVVAMGDDAEHDRSVGDGPVAVVVFDEADRLAGQRRADVDGVALPSDLAVVAHAPDGVVGAIARLAQRRRRSAAARRVMLGRRVVAERLVRPFVVVEALEAAQALELLAQASAPADRRCPATASDAAAPAGRSAAACRARCAPARRRP